jgi:hypothetical protein
LTGFKFSRQSLPQLVAVGGKVFDHSGYDGFLSTRVGFMEEKHFPGFGVLQIAVLRQSETMMCRVLLQELCQVPDRTVWPENRAKDQQHPQLFANRQQPEQPGDITLNHPTEFGSVGRLVREHRRCGAI